MTNIPIIFNHSILISQHESRVPPPTSHPPPTPQREADTYIQTNLTPWLHLFHYRQLRSMSNMVTAVHSYFQEESWAWRDLPYFTWFLLPPALFTMSLCFFFVLFFCFLSFSPIRGSGTRGLMEQLTPSYYLVSFVWFSFYRKRA